MAENQCLFKDVLQNSYKPKFKYYKTLLSHSEVRLNKVRSASIERDDDLHKTLSTNSDHQFHQNCYTTYISSQHIERYKKRKREEIVRQNPETIEQTPPQKKTRYYFLVPHFILLFPFLFCHPLYLLSFHTF